MAEEALGLYRAFESPWGQAHALISLALIGSEDAASFAHSLQAASAIAEKASLTSEASLIAALLLDAANAQGRHALIFV